MMSWLIGNTFSKFSPQWPFFNWCNTYKWFTFIGFCVSHEETMIVHKRQSAQRRGKGLVNSIINKLLVQLHIPGYQYCGPRTKLKERLARGDPGINPLDAACKEHDIAYSKNRDNLNTRHAADRVLTQRAWKRVLAKGASLGERELLGVSRIPWRPKLNSAWGLEGRENNVKLPKTRRCRWDTSLERQKLQ